MRVFITGATGLLGSHVAQVLHYSQHEVVALVRQNSDTSFLESLDVLLETAELTDLEGLTRAMVGCDAVVHSAATVVSRSPWEEYFKVNVRGTETVLEAAAQAGVRRAVHVSSVAVYGGARVARRAPVRESTPLDIPLSHGEFYARSKRLAEEVAGRFAGRLELSLVRPALLYGERDRIAIPRLLRTFRSPVVPLVGGGRSEVPLVYAGNVADAIEMMLLHVEAPGRAFNLATDFPITQRSLFDLLAELTGLQSRFVSIPYPVLYGAAATLETFSRLFSKRPPFINRRNVSFMGAGNPFDSSLVRRVLGWRPRIGHELGLARAIATPPELAETVPPEDT